MSKTTRKKPIMTARIRPEKAPKRLATYSRKDQHSQYEKQQQDDNAQFGAFARLVQLLLTSFFYPVKILNMGLKIARFLCSVIVASVLTHNPLVNSSNNMLIADLFTVMIAC